MSTNFLSTDRAQEQHGDTLPSSLSTKLAQHVGKLVSVADLLGRDPDTFSTAGGPKTKMAAAVLRATHTREFILGVALTRDQRSRLIGSGFSSLVFKSATVLDTIEKVNFKKTGSVGDVIERAECDTATFSHVKSILGDIVLSTRYEVGELDLRILPDRVPTVTSRQPFVDMGIDAFSDAGMEALARAAREDTDFRDKLSDFAGGTRELLADDILVDLTGSNNLTVTGIEPNTVDPKFTLVDVDPIDIQRLDIRQMLRAGIEANIVKLENILQR